MADLQTVFLGTSRRRTSEIIGSGVLLLAVVVVVLGFSNPVQNTINRYLITGNTLILSALLLLGAAGLTSYSNNGVIGSIAIATGPTIGFLFVNLAYASEPTVIEHTQFAVLYGAIIGVPIGITGYVIGRTIHWKVGS